MAPKKRLKINSAAVTNEVGETAALPLIRRSTRSSSVLEKDKSTTGSMNVAIDSSSKEVSIQQSAEASKEILEPLQALETGEARSRETVAYTLKETNEAIVKIPSALSVQGEKNATGKTSEGIVPASSKEKDHVGPSVHFEIGGGNGSSSKDRSIEWVMNRTSPPNRDEAYTPSIHDVIEGFCADAVSMATKCRRLIDLEKDIQGYEATMNEALDRCKDAEAKVADTESRYRDLENTMKAQTASSRKEKSEMKKASLVLQKSIDGLEAEKKVWLDEKVNLGNQIHILSGDFELAKQEIEKLKKDMETSQKDVENANKEKAELQTLYDLLQADAEANFQKTPAFKEIMDDLILEGKEAMLRKMCRDLAKQGTSYFGILKSYQPYEGFDPMAPCRGEPGYESPVEDGDGPAEEHGVAERPEARNDEAEASTRDNPESPSSKERSF